jgi:hypothetical protein
MSNPTPEEVKKQIQELTELRASARRWQIGTTLLIVVILCLGVGSIIKSVYDLTQSGPVQDQFVSELKTGLNKQVVPELKLIAERTMKDVKRDVEKELVKVNKRSPELIQALNKEVGVLQAHLPQRGEKILEATLGKELKAREAKIKTMFPNVKEEQVATLVNNLVHESHASMESLSATLFGPHIKALSGITANIDTIKRTEKLNPDEDIATWETAIGVLDILRDDIKVEDSKTPVAIKTVTSAKTEVK